jgi:hypothetical protein
VRVCDDKGATTQARQTRIEWGNRAGKAYDRVMRPATAIVILALLAIIAIAGVIQLWLLYST